MAYTHALLNKTISTSTSYLFFMNFFDLKYLSIYSFFLAKFEKKQGLILHNQGNQ